MECNGQCYLKEQLSKVSDDEKSNQKKTIRAEPEKFPVIISEFSYLITEPLNRKAQSGFKEYKFSINSLSTKPPTPPPQSL